ncbi:hypothetical protein OHQ88_34370 (plasmid) [Micromonospora zamorensis]|uniref:hypothetical protein n=1 Tax=Micromonospora zamorensis TaxID=709883 RepID=UPI002E24EDCA
MTYDIIDRARRRTRRTVTAAIASVAVVTALGTVVAVHHDPSARSSAGASPTSASGSGEDGGVELPTDLRWTPIAGVSLPQSGQAGPHDTVGGLARGFSHNKAGAVLAAVHIVVRVAPQVGPSVFDQTLRGQVIGPDAAVMRSRVAQDYDQLRANADVPYGQPVGHLAAALRGYRFTAYTAHEASLQILTEGRDGDGKSVLAASAVRLQWTGSDWSLVAPPGGDFNAAVSLAGDATGFHLFTTGR